MDEAMMVPVQEFKRLQDYYKGQMIENALLNKAGRLAGEEHLILKDKRIPDSMAITMTKPLSSEQGRLIKRIFTSRALRLKLFQFLQELIGIKHCHMKTIGYLPFFQDLYFLPSRLCRGVFLSTPCLSQTEPDLLDA